MREIIFRGKRKDNGKWVYGSLLKQAGEYISKDEVAPIECWICGMRGEKALIVSETIGQYTGLKDKNGTKIFEGDICWFYGGEYYSGSWEHNAIVAITDITDDEQIHYLKNAEYCEIIGNVFDSPELLEGKQ